MQSHDLSVLYPLSSVFAQLNVDLAFLLGKMASSPGFGDVFENVTPFSKHYGTVVYVANSFKARKKKMLFDT